MCYFNIREIWLNQSIEWFEIAPFLWLGLSILIIVLSLVFYFITEWYFIISIILWFCLFANLFFDAANKPLCFERELKYGYKANISLPNNGNTYKVYFKTLQTVMQKYKPEEMEEFASEEAMAKKFQTYEDLFPSITDSDYVASYNKEALHEFVTDTIINHHFYTLNHGAVYNVENVLKEAKFTNKIPSILYKNGKFFRYKLLAVTPQMITDSAGIIMVNLGEVSFE
jgi:hypothetical protein